ncbi:hypothetical protein E2C00_00600 [Streptomyces sp. WAC05374]|uniref:hypothetical protein n=1 Tax=Streptomyces sp. WAC05374 TaxID=2487420 RepID=UPI000F85E4F6|nr:hypothetical protein [Streptomyces sp. WAC05374]RST19593.1 hypothetical protein EF905_00345 [Streptomyces sp. WAC05374]TDF50070.1 hypothetical protein E2B92_00575 [Streptomyces sp. WAC05374]TDF57796.1 hypothetical protein E2C02_08365 [Streptomyces sp. WAC05374]TDF60324.1 hypothetical protein E2C00_00600 [Streptomyces sp. WAC05374]
MLPLHLVPAHHDESQQPGEFVAEALYPVEQAREVLQRAVIYERQRHRWETIGESLGVTRQTAHERFKDAETGRQRDLIQPHEQVRGRACPVLHEAALHPTATGRRLDAWATAHSRNHAGDEHPVTATGHP